MGLFGDVVGGVKAWAGSAATTVSDTAGKYAQMQQNYPGFDQFLVTMQSDPELKDLLGKLIGDVPEGADEPSKLDQLNKLDEIAGGNEQFFMRMNKILNKPNAKELLKELADNPKTLESLKSEFQGSGPVSNETLQAIDDLVDLDAEMGANAQYGKDYQELRGNLLSNDNLVSSLSKLGGNATESGLQGKMDMMQDFKDMADKHPKMMGQLNTILKEPGAAELLDKLADNPAVQEALQKSGAGGLSYPVVIERLAAAAAQDGNVFELINKQLAAGGNGALPPEIMSDPNKILDALDVAADAAQLMDIKGSLSAQAIEDIDYLESKFVTKDGQLKPFGKTIADAAGMDTSTGQGFDIGALLSHGKLADELVNMAPGKRTEFIEDLAHDLRTIADAKDLDKFLTTVHGIDDVAGSTKNMKLAELDSFADALEIRLAENPNYFTETNEFLNSDMGQGLIRTATGFGAGNMMDPAKMLGSLDIAHKVHDFISNGADSLGQSFGMQGMGKFLTSIMNVFMPFVEKIAGVFGGLRKDYQDGGWEAVSNNKFQLAKNAGANLWDAGIEAVQNVPKIELPSLGSPSS